MSEPRRAICRQAVCTEYGKRGPCRRCSDLAANAERMRRRHADPEFAAANAERAREWMRRLNADPEFAAANAERGRERMCRLNADPEFAAAHAERMRRLNADPEFAARQRASIEVKWAPEMDDIARRCSNGEFLIDDAAERIGVARTTLIRRMNALGLRHDRARLLERS